MDDKEIQALVTAAVDAATAKAVTETVKALKDAEPATKSAGVITVTHDEGDNLFESVADLEDPERSAIKAGAGITGGIRELELKRAIAGHTETGGSEIAARRDGSAFASQRRIDALVQVVGKGRARIEVEHQNGISVLACWALAAIAS